MSSHVLDSEQWFLSAHPRSNSGYDRVFMGSKQNGNNKEHCFHKVIFFPFKEVSFMKNKHQKVVVEKAK